MAEFKDRLEEALAMRNMKPSELARITGIGEGAISQYRKGAYKATQRNLEKISNVLDVSIPWLMGTEEKAPLQVDGHYKSKLRAISRLEDSQITPAQDAQIADYIDFLLSKKNDI